MKQTIQARQASVLYNTMDPVRQTLLRDNAGQCGRDTSHCSLKMVGAVATMDYLAALAHEECSDTSLFCAATLHRYVIPYDYAILYTHVIS